MSDLAEFNKKVLDTFAKRITDEVFLMIQNDRDLMQAYLKIVGSKTKPVVNRGLGQAIKKRFELTNEPTRNDQPRSLLLVSFQEFE
jgi:hypothetical protein